MEDKELIRRILAGEAELFKILVEKYQEMVFHTSIGLLHNREEADDIAQEVFIEVFESLRFFRQEAKISTWIYRITVNKSLNHLKKLKRREMMERIEDLFKKNRSDPKWEPMSDGPDKNIESDEENRKVQALLDSLPENQRIAFTLFKYDDLSQKEISEVMDLSVSAVESLIFRAKISLQKKFAQYARKKKDTQQDL